MHDSEQERTSAHRCALVIHLERSLDRAEMLQSLELQRLQVVIDRRQLRVLPESSTSNCDVATISVRDADIVIRSRRAA